MDVVLSRVCPPGFRVLCSSMVRLPPMVQSPYTVGAFEEMSEIVVGERKPDG